MNKNQFAPPEIQEISYIFNIIPYLDMERKYLHFEDVFKKTFNSNVILTKVPDNAPINIPRFVIQSRESTLEASIINIKYSNKFQSRNDAKKTIQKFASKINSIFEKLTTIENIVIESIEEIIVIKYPQKRIDQQLLKELYKSYFTNEPPDTLDNFSFEYKYPDETYIHTVKIQTYISQEVVIQHQEKQPRKDKQNFIFKVPADQLKVVDRGVAIVKHTHTKDIDTSNPDNIKISFKLLNESMKNSIKLSSELLFK